MSDIDPRYLELFPSWLRTLGEDATAVGLALEGRREKDDFGRYLAAGLNYIFKSLDLIPDGIDDLGFLDDAFVLRVAAGFAIEKDRPTRSPEGTPPTPLDTVIRSRRTFAACARARRAAERSRTSSATRRRARRSFKRCRRGARPTRCRASRATSRRSSS
jgi:uncharacterized membrane protein YkvA (DUF1232 family)